MSAQAYYARLNLIATELNEVELAIRHAIDRCEGIIYEEMARLKGVEKGGHPEECCDTELAHDISNGAPRPILTKALAFHCGTRETASF